VIFFGVLMSIQDRITQLVERFNSFSQWEDRYKELIQNGKKLAPLEETDKIDKFRIKGCQSQVWLKPEYKDGVIHFYADSDAVLVKGIISLLLEVYSGETPEVVMATPPQFLKDIGITEHLTMNRTNGLASMVKQIQMYGTAFSALKQKGVLNADL
jgi:cysteine desulfuration protein SufE